MKACAAYGPGDLRLISLPDPDPGPDDIVVQIAYGGICGSDLHYYRDGAVGDYTLVEALVLGHEVAGTITSVGQHVHELVAGQRIAIHPATPCGSCPECSTGRHNLCRRSRYLGSAAHRPHVQGGFCEFLVIPATQAIPLPEALDLRTATLAEPLSVALHAVRQACTVVGRRVLVTGAGPIGCLVVAVLNEYGAGEIIVSDLEPHALAIAHDMGATSTILANTSEDSERPADVDLVIEASGSGQAFQTALTRVVRGGQIVQLGMLPSTGTRLPGNLLVTHEISLVGSFRFDDEMPEAVRLLASGLNVDPILTHTQPFSNAVAAFNLAGDRSRASKVLLDLTAHNRRRQEC